MKIKIGITGAKSLKFRDTGLFKDGAEKETPAYSFSNDPDTGLFRRTVYELLWIEVEKIERRRRIRYNAGRNHRV